MSKNDIKIKDFHCSVHGAVKPEVHPKCPFCTSMNTQKECCEKCFVGLFNAHEECSNSSCECHTSMNKECCEKCQGFVAAQHGEGPVQKTYYCKNPSCECHSPQNNWEEQLSNQCYFFGDIEPLKSFIRGVLASERETLATGLEEKKGKLPSAIENSLISPLESYRKEDQMYGYNLGLTDAAAHIRKQ